MSPTISNDPVPNNNPNHFPLRSLRAPLFFSLAIIVVVIGCGVMLACGFEATFENFLMALVGLAAIVIALTIFTQGYFYFFQRKITKARLSASLNTSIQHKD